MSRVKILFKKNLKKILKKRGLTQKQLAKRIGKTDATLSEILRDDTETSTLTIESIAKALKISPYKLFLTEEEAKTLDAKDVLIADLLRQIEKNKK